MKYDAQTFFTEEEYENVSGFTVLAAREGRYHIAEKWEKDSGQDRWIAYGVPASDFEQRVARGACEQKAELTEEQYSAVCEKVNFRYDKGETPAEMEEAEA